MGHIIPFSELPKIIIKDIHFIERYTFEQVHYSIVYFKISAEVDSKLMAKIVAKSSRRSDAVFVYKNNFILLLPGIDKSGAEYVCQELSSFSKDLNDLISFTYPDELDKEEVIINKIVELVDEPIEKLHWSSEVIDEIENKIEELKLPNNYKTN